MDHEIDHGLGRVVAEQTQMKKIGVVVLAAVVAVVDDRTNLGVDRSGDKSTWRRGMGRKEGGDEDDEDEDEDEEGDEETGKRTESD